MAFFASQKIPDSVIITYSLKRPHKDWLCFSPLYFIWWPTPFFSTFPDHSNYNCCLTHRRCATNVWVTNTLQAPWPATFCEQRLRHHKNLKGNDRHPGSLGIVFLIMRRNKPLGSRTQMSFNFRLHCPRAIKIKEAFVAPSLWWWLLRINLQSKLGLLITTDISIFRAAYI